MASLMILIVITGTEDNITNGGHDLWSNGAQKILDLTIGAGDVVDKDEGYAIGFVADHRGGIGDVGVGQEGGQPKPEDALREVEDAEHVGEGEAVEDGHRVFHEESRATKIAPEVASFLRKMDEIFSIWLLEVVLQVKYPQIAGAAIVGRRANVGQNVDTQIEDGVEKDAEIEKSGTGWNDDLEGAQIVGEPVSVWQDDETQEAKDIEGE